MCRYGHYQHRLLVKNITVNRVTQKVTIDLKKTNENLVNKNQSWKSVIANGTVKEEVHKGNQEVKDLRAWEKTRKIDSQMKESHLPGVRKIDIGKCTSEIIVGLGLKNVQWI